MSSPREQKAVSTAGGSQARGLSVPGLPQMPWKCCDSSCASLNPLLPSACVTTQLECCAWRSDPGAAVLLLAASCCNITGSWHRRSLSAGCRTGTCLRQSTTDRRAACRVWGVVHVKAVARPQQGQGHGVQLVAHAQPQRGACTAAMLRPCALQRLTPGSFKPSCRRTLLDVDHAWRHRTIICPGCVKDIRVCQAGVVAGPCTYDTGLSLPHTVGSREAGSTAPPLYTD